MNQNNNELAKKGSGIKLLGTIVIVIGLLLGLYLLGEGRYDAWMGIVIMISTIFSGAFFIALAEIIGQLDEINRKLDK